MGCGGSSQNGIPVCSANKIFSACRNSSVEEFKSIVNEAFEKSEKTGKSPSQYCWPLVGNPKRTVLMQIIQLAKKTPNIQTFIAQCMRVVIESPFECQLNAVTYDNARYSVLDMAAGAGQGGQFLPEVILLLLEKGAKADKVSGDGYSPLHLYCRVRNFSNQEQLELHCQEIIPLYLHNGADINKLDAQGRTPLYWAISSGYPALVKLLLLNGAKPDKLDLERVDHVTRYDQQGRELVKKYIKLAMQAHKPDEEEFKQQENNFNKNIQNENNNNNNNLTTLKIPLGAAAGSPLSNLGDGTQSLSNTYRTLNPQTPHNNISPTLASNGTLLRSYTSASGTAKSLAPTKNNNIGGTMQLAANIVPKKSKEEKEKEKKQEKAKELQQKEKEKEKKLLSAQSSKKESPNESGANTPVGKKSSIDEKNKKFATMRAPSNANKTSISNDNNINMGLQSERNPNGKHSRNPSSGALLVPSSNPNISGTMKVPNKSANNNNINRTMTMTLPKTTSNNKDNKVYIEGTQSLKASKNNPTKTTKVQPKNSSSDDEEKVEVNTQNNNKKKTLPKSNSSYSNNNNNNNNVNKVPLHSSNSNINPNVNINPVNSEPEEMEEIVTTEPVVPIILPPKLSIINTNNNSKRNLNTHALNDDSHNSIQSNHENNPNEYVYGNNSDEDN